MNRSPLSNISNSSKAKGRKVGQRKKVFRVGRWEKNERIAFLRAFRIHGKGKWKLISEMIPNRSTVQVKTHAQHVMRLIDEGLNPFEELDNYYASVGAAPKYDKNMTTMIAKKVTSPVEISAAYILVNMKTSDLN